MAKFLRWLGRATLVLFLIIAGAYAFAPEEPVDREIAFDPKVIGADPDAYLAASELKFSDIRQGEQKRIVWAGAKGQKTPLSIIYIHGFSAGPMEISPVPEKVAAGLGVNLYFTRLAGHGRTGDAMAEPVAGDWLEDFAEAMAIGRMLGDRVLVMATSTGGTLSVLGASDPALSEGMAGLVLVSPNFGVKALAGRLLDMPFARHWAPLVAGQTRSFEARNEGHAAHWTTSYPTAALFPMAALVREAGRLDPSAISLPVLVLFSPEDQVVDPDRTRALMARWGGPTRLIERHMGPGDDDHSHVIAGDIVSPGQTGETVALILDWAASLQ